MSLKSIISVFYSLMIVECYVPTRFTRKITRIQRDNDLLDIDMFLNDGLQKPCLNAIVLNYHFNGPVILS